jgi:hypothetical protein
VSESPLPDVGTSRATSDTVESKLDRLAVTVQSENSTVLFSPRSRESRAAATIAVRSRESIPLFQVSRRPWSQRIGRFRRFETVVTTLEAL